MSTVGLSCSALLLALAIAAPGQALADARGSTNTDGPSKLNVAVLAVGGSGLKPSSIRGRLETAPPTTSCDVQFHVRGIEASGEEYDETRKGDGCMWPAADFPVPSNGFKEGSKMCMNSYWNGRWGNEYACVMMHG